MPLGPGPGGDKGRVLLRLTILLGVMHELGTKQLSVIRN